MRIILNATILGLAATTFTACSPVATFPSDTRALTSNSVPSEPVPTLIAEAVNYACSMYDPDGDPSINLPAGTSILLYRKVIDRLGDGHPKFDPNEPSFSIVKVRARGIDAEVDMFIPNIDGSHSFATLTFRREFRKYAHIRTKWWDTGEQLPPVNYVVIEWHEADQVPDVDGPVEQPVLAHD
jgi:hypothetical protein